MRSILIFSGVYILSVAVAYAVGIQVAAYFFLDEEFIAVVFALGLFSVVAIAVFAMVNAVQPNVKWLGYAAIGLGVIAFGVGQIPELVDAIASRSTNPYLVGREQDRAIAVSLLLPALVMLLIQWPLLRRHWLLARGLEHRTPWPWFTIALACALALDRPGLDVIGSVIDQSSTDWLVGLWTLIVAIACGVLVALGMLEWWLRRRRLARRAATH